MKIKPVTLKGFIITRIELFYNTTGDAIFHDFYSKSQNFSSFLGLQEILRLFKVAGRVGTWVTLSHGLILDVRKIMGISSSAGPSTNGPIFNHYLEISKMVTFTNRARCGFTFNTNEN